MLHRMRNRDVGANSLSAGMEMIWGPFGHHSRPIAMPMSLGPG